MSPDWSSTKTNTMTAALLTLFTIASAAGSCCWPWCC
jgi:hypothetical protein